MKKMFTLLCMQLLFFGAFAQNDCLDFQNETPNPNPGWTNPPSNWNTIDCNYDFKQQGSNIYLEVKDDSGASFIYNNVDFTGDLSNANNCQTFCFDLNYLDAGANNATTFRNSIYIYSGGTTPLNSPLCARYVLNTPVSAGSGWNTFCLPLDFCNGTTLPDNAEGYWEWIYSTSFNNTGSTCTDWSNLITSVTGISFYIDLGSNPSEEWGLDNFCLIDTTCYNDKQFSTCFYTDVEDPTANNFNEFGFAGCQKQDGNFFVFGETQNRGLFAPSNVTDDYFLRANLDDFGNVQPIADYIHPDNPADVRFDNHILVKMDPIFTTVNSSLLAFSNYQATGTNNHDVQVTFFDAETDCIESTGNWPNTPNSSEFVKDVMQGSNSDLVILGECYDHATPDERRPFLYGYDITGADFGNQKLNVIAPDGNGLAQVNVNAITEYTSGSTRRYAVVGEVNDRVLFFDIDLSLNTTGTYLWLDVDNDPVTQETAIDISFDDQDNTFVIAGNIFQPQINDPNGPILQSTTRIFVSKMNLQGQILWTNVYNIPGGAENVRELHLNEKREIVIAGSCEIEDGFVPVGSPRNDISYLLKTAKNGSFLWANKYLNAEGNQVLDLEYCIDKGYLMTGSCWTNFPDPNGGPFLNILQNHDVFAVKTDSLGMLGPDAEVCVTSTDVGLVNPDYETGINEIWGEGIEFDGEDHTFECIPYVHEQQICAQYCPPPPNEVCDITTTMTTTQTDSCCMASLDLTNNMIGAHQIRIDILDPNLPPVTPTTSYFDVVNVNAPFCLVSQTPTQVILEMCGGGPIPTGNLSNYFEFCLADSLGTATSNQVRVFHMNSFGIPFSGCFDDLTIECPMLPEPCYELVVEEILCTDITGVFDVCFTVTNNDVVDSLKWLAFTSPGIAVFSSNPVCLSPPLAPGETSSQVCIQIMDATGLPLPRQITLHHDAHNTDYISCCRDSSIVTLPNCCEPCVPDWVVVSPDSLGADSCCFALDFNVDCPLSLKQLRVESITPGVELVNAALGSSGSGIWNLTTTNTTAVLDPSSGSTAPIGFYDDLLNFCLNDTVGVPIQEVIVSYIGCTPLGADTILCQDTLQFNCEIDTDCIEIIEESVYCDDDGNYFVDFCVQNVSAPAFNANKLVITKISSTPSSLGILPGQFYPISLPYTGVFCGTVQVVGVNPQPGDKIVLGFALHQDDGVQLDTCCIDEQELCVILPECEPMVGECCENIDVFQALASQTTIIYSGGVVTVDNPNLNDCHFVDILWGDGFGVDHNAAANLPFTHSYAAPGTYTVDVLISEESPNGELCFEFALSQTIQTQLVPIETHVRMYPNPFVDQLEVQLSEVIDNNQELEVRTANGTLVHRTRLTEGQREYKIDASQWGAGLYIIYIKNEEGIQSTQRLVKINP